MDNGIYILGKNYGEIYSKMDFYDLEGKVSIFRRHMYCQGLKGEKVKNLKIKSIRDGNIRYIDNSGIPVFNKHTQLEFVIMISQNITTEVKANLIMKKALKSRQEFIVNISHGLKTPLNVMSATVQLLNI